MPIIELPDGRRVDVPDDATPEQLTQLRSKLLEEFPELAEQQPTPEPAPAQPAPEQPSSVKAPTNIAEALGGSAESVVRNIGSGFFGVGDIIAAGSAQGGRAAGNVIRRAAGKEPIPLPSFDEARREEQQRARDLANLYRGTGFAGQAFGAGSPLRALNKLPSFFKLQKGQAFANTLRIGGGGGAAAAVTEANQGGDARDIRNAAAAGVILAPAFGAGARAGGAAFDAVRSAVDKNVNRGFRALASALNRGKGEKQIEEATKALREKAANFRVDTGRAPTVVELLEPEDAARLRDITQPGRAARERLDEFARGQPRRLQESVVSNVERGRVTTGAERVRERRGASFDAFMRQNAKRPVTVTADDVRQLLDDPGVARIIPPRARKALQEIRGGAGDITLRDADNIRQALNKAANAGGESIRFRNVADKVREIAEESVPGFDDALVEFRRRSATASGVERGARSRSTPDTEFRQAVDTLRKTSTDEAIEVGERRAATSELAGVRVGQRTGVADDARRSAGSARTVATELAEGGSAGRRVAELDPQEAQRLERAARAELDALSSVQETVRGTRLGDAFGKELDDLQSAGELSSLLTGRGSAGFTVSVLKRTIQRLFRVPPSAAEKLANVATDPARTDDVIDALRRAGVEPDDAEQFARLASRVAARTAAPAAAEEL